jgi:hypothetical protein
VRHVENAADRVGQRVHGRHRRVRKGLPGQAGAQQHALARVEVVAVLAGRVRLATAGQRLARQHVRQRILLVLAGIGFDRMHHGVDAGGGGDHRRQAQRSASASSTARSAYSWGATTPILVVSPVVTMAMFVTSEPVPAVVGTCTSGRRLPVTLPMPYISASGWALPASTAISLATSIELPPPRPITRSVPCCARTRGRVQTTAPADRRPRPSRRSPDALALQAGARRLDQAGAQEAGIGHDQHAADAGKTFGDELAEAAARRRFGDDAGGRC